MKIYTKEATGYLAALAESLPRDPLSFSGLQCLYYPSHLREGRVALSALIERLHSSLPPEVEAEECTFLLTEKGDLLLICPGRDLKGLFEFGARLHTVLTGGTEVLPVFDLRRDHEAAARLFRILAEGAAPALPSSDYDEEIGAPPPAVDEVFSNARASRAARSPIHVMVVEDDIITRRVVSNLLKGEHVLISAPDAESALVNYLIYAPDLVFLDINLPGASGFSFLRRTKAFDPAAHIVMFSGNHTPENVMRALLNGAWGFVPKPFEREQLRHYITGVTVEQIRAHGQTYP